MARPSDALIGETLLHPLTALGMKTTTSDFDVALWPRSALVSAIDDDLEILASIIDKLSAHHARLRRQRNSVASTVRNLPIEIVQKMIVQSLPHWPRLSDPSRLEALRTVCSSWSQAILSNREAWAVIRPSYAKTPRQIELLLKRSRNAPLIIEGDAAILTATTPHSDRVQSLEIQCAYEVARSLLIQPMPQLRSLVLGDQFTMRIYVDFSKRLFSGIAPPLSRLQTDYVSALREFEPATLRGLNDLTVLVPKNDASTPQEALPQIGRIVSICSHLRSLHIWITCRWGPADLDIALPPVDSLQFTTYGNRLEGLLQSFQCLPLRQCFLKALDDVQEFNPNATSLAATKFLHIESPLTLRITQNDTSLKAYNGTGCELVILTTELCLFSRCLPKFFAESPTFTSITHMKIVFRDSRVWDLYASGGMQIPEGVREVQFRLESGKVSGEALGLLAEEGPLPKSLTMLETWDPETCEWVDRRQEANDCIARRKALRDGDYYE